MKTVVLHDIDSRIPNLALMKLSAHYRQLKWNVVLSRPRTGGPPARIDADRHVASAVFYAEPSMRRVDSLRRIYGERFDVGGSGVSLERRLPPEIETLFPDYSLYRHRLYALGFLTRGCNKRCAFCIVPAKEGPLKRPAQSFDAFVPPRQRNVMLLDDNLLSYPGVEDLLLEMICRRYAVNFNQTLDVTYLNESNYGLLRRIDYRNARFDKPMIYFSLNYPKMIEHFRARRHMLEGFGQDCVTVVCIYGFDTSLSQDYERFYWLRRLWLIPFFQEYWPIPGVPARLPENYFDMDLNRMIRLTFRSNGYNWEKYLRWLNLRYFRAFGRFYRPLVEIIHRYNNKERLEWFKRHPELMTDTLYRDLRSDSPARTRSWSTLLEKGRLAPGTPPGFKKIVGAFSTLQRAATPADS